MALKDLLLHVDLSEPSRLRARLALALAARHQAHLTALCLVAEPYMPAMIGVSIPPETLGAQLRAAADEAAALLDRVRTMAEALDVPIELRQETAPVDGLPSILARQALHADLAIVGQPNPGIDGLDDAMLAESAFLRTGRPALVVPYAGAGPEPPTRALVSWDGSAAAARAVNDALPLLVAAERVVVIVVDPDRLGERVGQQPGADLGVHLARHGVKVEVKAVSGGGLGVGDVLLAEAVDLAADLLVMGGFGHSRLRELILGGTTRHVLKHMTLPVLFSH
jgi:nucleotide-binding universal stress UspA family protein